MTAHDLVVFGRELHKHASSDWPNYCRFIRACDPDVVTHYAQLALTYGRKDLFGTTVAFLLGMACISPVVEYVIDPALFAAFENAGLEESPLILGEAIKLPYPCVALRRGGDPDSEYTVVSVHEGNLLGIGPVCLKTDLQRTFQDVFIQADPALRSRLNFILSSILYITNNRDVEVAKKHVKVARAKKFRKSEVKYEQIRGTVGNKFSSALVRYEEAMLSAVASSPTVAGEPKRRVRPHCRAGHWQRYHVGKGRTEVVTIFVHACLVGVQDLAQIEIQRKVR